MECKWKPHHAAAPSKQRQMGNGEASGPSQQPSLSPPTDRSSGTSGPRTAQAMDEVFDYASFLWDPGSSLWQQASPDLGDSGGFDASAMETVPYIGGHTQPPTTSSTYSDTPMIQSNGDQPETQKATTADEKLMDFFIKSATPPILAGVEPQRKWQAIRQVLASMAKKSGVLHGAILAFSNSLLCRSDLSWALVEQSHYKDAVAELAAYDSHSLEDYSQHRECLLAALFFLSYVDILESRLDAAHLHLKRAYTTFQQGNKASFSHVEKQVLLWIRLLDARAVSAGGEGLFLQGDETDLVEASPASFEAETDDASRNQDVIGDNIEDVLFQVLYQPGIVFYQKVQSFMGRISKIDPWHRSRGTVEDEIEVMNIGATIAADLRALFEQRPPLMDYAVAGRLSEPHVSAHLAFTITRAFRTYLANYYASKVHLHRVAYKHLPLTREATDALNQIRRLARQLASDLGVDDSLPVNMLWPLLMLGAEEQDSEEKAWIKSQILRMERVAGNARITAQVLEEVQARQGAAKARVDIRSVMHSVFNSCFAIV